MMLAAILAAAAVVTQGPAGVGGTSPPQAAGPSAATALSTAEQLRQLKDIYLSSCGDRAYGSFEDACHEMSKQIREVEKAVRKEAQQSQRQR